MVMVFDSWAGELSPSSFKTFSQPYLADISRRLPARLTALGLDPAPMAVFPKGAWHSLDAVCGLGYQVVGLDWLRDPADAILVRGDRTVVFQGNADPGVLYGTRESIRNVVGDMVRGFGGGKRGWIANLGHGITPGVDPDDLKFFLEEVRRLTSD